eukprot:scaffold97592_cov75-Phaeocystis_antarctica.AAC.2
MTRRTPRRPPVGRIAGQRAAGCRRETVREVPVRGGGRGVLIHLVQGELAWVLLVLHHIEPQAAGLSAGAYSVLSHDLEELVEPLRLDLHLNKDGHHVRDGAVQARRHSPTATVATSGVSAGCGRERVRRVGTSLRKRLSCESGPARFVSGPAIELDATKAEVRGSETARSSSIIPKSERKLEVSDKHKEPPREFCLGEA